MVPLFSLLNLDYDMVGENKLRQPNTESYISVLLIQRSIAGALQRLVCSFAKVSLHTPAIGCCVRALVQDGVGSHFSI